MRRVSVLEPKAGASGERLSAEPRVRADAACGATEASGEAVSGEARTGQESPRTCEPLAEGLACVKALGSDRRHLGSPVCHLSLERQRSRADLTPVGLLSFLLREV